MKVYDYSKLSPSMAGGRTGLRCYSKFVVCATLLLIFAGSLVTSTGSGLAVPDWPNTYGYFMFAFPLSDMAGGVFYEHGHRLVASCVGFLTIILAVWMWRKEKRRAIKILGWCALAVVVLQGLLGGLTVLFYLPTAVSLSHAVLAQTFFVLTVVIAYSLSREFRLRQILVDEPSCQAVKWPVLILALIVYLQLIAGALMRHTGSGLAIPDFPAMGGRFLPWFDGGMLSWINAWRFDADLDPVSLTQVIIHFVHRLMGVVVFVWTVFLVVQASRHTRRHKKVFRHILAVLCVVCIQFGLGIFTVLSQKQYHVASVHVVMGALLLGMSVLLVLRVLGMSWLRGN